MNKYVDKLGLYNVKEIKEDGMPSGNDGWIITAYAKKAGLPIDRERILDAYRQLPKNEFGIPTQRLPDKSEPPMSRDVILGMVWLGLLDVNTLVKANWNFSPFPLPAHDPEALKDTVKDIALAKAKVWLYEKFDSLKNFSLLKKNPALVDKAKEGAFGDMSDEEALAHRNVIWKDGGTPQLWRYAFSTPIQDRAYLMRLSNMKVPLSYTLYEKLSEKFSSKSDSSELIKWAKTGKSVGQDVFARYFPTDHPIPRAVLMSNVNAIQS